MNEAKHYGVKGMHWGVHRSETKLERGARLTEKHSQNSKVFKSASTSEAVKGAAQVAAILYVGGKASMRVPGSRNLKVLAGARLANYALAGTVGTKKVKNIRAINAYNSSQAR